MRKSYLDFTMEQERKKGFEFYEYVDGLPRPLTRQSNLRKVIEAAWDDGYIEAVTRIFFPLRSFAQAISFSI